MVDFEAMQNEIKRQGLLIDEIYRIIVDNTSRQPVQTIEDSPMNVSEASLFLGIPVQTIYTKKTIPRHKRGKRVFFYRSELQSYVKGE